MLNSCMSIMSVLAAVVLGTTNLSGNLFSELLNCPGGRPVLFEEDVASTVECGGLCLTTAGCVGMTYLWSQPYRGVCRGYRSMGVTTVDDSAASAVGSSTFVRDQHCSGSVDVTPTNVAEGKPAVQSSTTRPAGRAVDGNKSPSLLYGKSCTHTLPSPTTREWWQVDIGQPHRVFSVKITNRALFADRLRDFDVHVYSEDPRTNENASYGICRHYEGPMGAGVTEDLACYCAPYLVGQFVRVVNAIGSVLTLCEVHVMAAPLQP